MAYVNYIGYVGEWDIVIPLHEHDLFGARLEDVGEATLQTVPADVILVDLEPRSLSWTFVDDLHHDGPVVRLILGLIRRRRAFSAFAMLGASIPSFWFGLILMQIFAVGLGWFPVAGYGDPGVPLSERLHHLVLPSIVLGVVNSALILRFTRASMLDVLGDDHIRTARAKGLSEASVILRHALRNALIPVITVLGLTFALLIGGAIVTETVFGLPGVGNLVVSAVLRRDYPVIQGALLVIAGLYVLINLAIDLLYLVVDPRVKY